MNTSLPTSAIAAFAALVMALVCLWMPSVVRSARGGSIWTIPFAAALIFAYAGGVIDVRGILAVLAFGSLCKASQLVTHVVTRSVVHATVLAMAAALYLHAVPGFDNPLVIADVVVSPDAVPFTKYLNFDKGVAALLLLGLFVPTCVATDRIARRIPAFLWRFAVVTVVVMLLSLSVGYVRWDVKIAPWWPTWAWTMIFLTALPEETLFRGVMQRGIERWAGGRPQATAVAVVSSGLLFGLAHVAGGLTYVMLAAVAGIGYGWVFASTRSLAAAILTHAGVNAVHFVFFTYPALSGVGVHP